MRGCLRLHTAAVAALRAGAASRYGVRGCSSGVGRRRPLSERLKAFYGKDPAFKARAAALEIDRTKEGIVQSVGAGSVSAEGGPRRACRNLRLQLTAPRPTGLTGAKVGEVVTFEGSDAVGARRACAGEGAATARAAALTLCAPCASQGSCCP